MPHAPQSRSSRVILQPHYTRRHRQSRPTRGSFSRRVLSQRVTAAFSVAGALSFAAKSRLVKVHQKEWEASGQTQRVLSLRRAVVISVLCLITLFAQEPSSSPQIAPVDKGRSRDVVQKGKTSEARPSVPKRLFERLLLQLIPSPAAPPSADLGAIGRLYDLATILLVGIFLQWVVLIVQAYYLYKLAGESRRVAHTLRDNVRLNRQAVELSRQALILNEPPKLKIRSVEVRPRPYASGIPSTSFREIPPLSAASWCEIPEAVVPRFCIARLHYWRSHILNRFPWSRL